MLDLVTFGGLALEAVNEAVAPRLSAQRLAILAVLVAEGDRRVTRERLTGLFWPDSEGEPDRAAVHYRAIVRAWANADEPFHARRETARQWLVRYARNDG